MTFTFPLDVPPNKVKGMLIDAARSTPDVASQPEPKAHAVEIEDDRIRYQAVLTLDNPKKYRKLIDAYTTRVWYAAQRAGVKLPLPREVHEHRVEGEAGADLEQSAIVALLQKVAALNGLAKESLVALAEKVERKWFAAGEGVLREGDMCNALYVIASGRARLMHRGDAEEASEILQLRAGELFGESALSRGQLNPESIVADTDLEVLRIPLSELEALLERSPQTAHHFANLIDMRAEAMRRIAGNR
jgi:hypothetical protein